MDACLETGVDYLDTANYEPRDVAKFEYKWQWAYQDRFKKAGLMALLGSRLRPGRDQRLLRLRCRSTSSTRSTTLDIVDCNAGSHGQPFATNFNPEINIREVTARGRYWENGEWKETDPLAVSADASTSPGIGPKKIYLLYHEELESLVQALQGPASASASG